MTELEVRNLIKETMAEPKPPDDLVAVTIERGKGIENGRRAEQRLQSEGQSLSVDEKKNLAAQGIIGRALIHKMPPKGVSFEKMTEMLLKTERFQQVTELDSAELANEIKNGDLLKKITKAPNENTVEKIISEPEIKSPELRKPEIKNFTPTL